MDRYPVGEPPRTNDALDKPIVAVTHEYRFPSNTSEKTVADTMEMIDLLRMNSECIVSNQELAYARDTPENIAKNKIDKMVNVILKNIKRHIVVTSDRDYPGGTRYTAVFNLPYVITPAIHHLEDQLDLSKQREYDLKKEIAELKQSKTFMERVCYIIRG